MKKSEFMAARDAISEIEDLLDKATDLFNEIPDSIQTAILNYHNATSSLNHCLRWGLQAAEELREDWHTVVAGMPCEEGGAT
jgi:hypothetical protein